MKYSVLLSLLLFMVSQEMNGQWYHKKYNASNIDLLTGSELSESLSEAKGNLVYSGFAAAGGGLLILSGKYTLKHGLDEDATILEQLLGAKVIGKSVIFLGKGLAAGGVVAGVIYLGRIARIQTTLKRNFPSGENMTLGPELNYDSFTKSYSPGIVLRYNF